MKCPYCGDEDIRVIDSRPAENAIRRRRQCGRCEKRFTTYERIETIPMMIVKKDETREPYDRSKIEAGMLGACHKRPVSVAMINDAVDDIENQIMTRDRREISTTEIGELVMDKLREIDDVAYVRFASVYREFKDVETFLREIEKLAKKRH